MTRATSAAAARERSGRGVGAVGATPGSRRRQPGRQRRLQLSRPMPSTRGARRRRPDCGSTSGTDGGVRLPRRRATRCGTAPGTWRPAPTTAPRCASTWTGRRSARARRVGRHRLRRWTTNNNLRIGDYADPPECLENTNFNGEVDEARVYSRALSGDRDRATGRAPAATVAAGARAPPPAPAPRRPRRTAATHRVAAYAELGISHQLLGGLTLGAQASVASTGRRSLSDYHWAITGPDKPLNFDCGGGATSCRTRSASPATIRSR